MTETERAKDPKKIQSGFLHRSLNESPNQRRTVSIEIDEAHYQFLCGLCEGADDPHENALHLADRILNQQLAEEMKLEFFLKDGYQIDAN